jgi:histidyl-tRNA synthetase
MAISIPKGLFDILPYGADQEWKLAHYWRYVEQTAQELSLLNGYSEIRTPIFERTEVFSKVGETSDIVSKELYTFSDKKGRSMSLRPEGTASIMRAFVEDNLAPLRSLHKFYYLGPMFRYDRPQAGRYRQFHQFGVEAVGKFSYETDIEVILLAYSLYEKLGLKNISILINCMGDIAARQAFANELKKFLKPHFSDLSEDSKVRFEKNPLRILDSKEAVDQELLKGAPSILSFLSDSAAKEFDKICSFLKRRKIPFTITDRLVRGLDYYTNTVFEFVSTSLGAQNSIGGGGRYDNLVSSFKGPDIPGVGFAAGIERIIQAMVDQKVFFPTAPSPFVYLIPLEESVYEKLFSLTLDLRNRGIFAEMERESKKIQKGLKNSSSLLAKYSLIVGEEEWKNEVAILKNMQSGEQEKIPFSSLLDHIQTLHKAPKNN